MGHPVVGGSRKEPLVGRSEGKAPAPEAETLLAFGCSVEATNLLEFLVLGNARQKSQIAYTAYVVLLNLTFNKSHLGMPIPVTNRHFITTNISPERQRGSKGMGGEGADVFHASSLGRYA